MALSIAGLIIFLAGVYVMIRGSTFVWENLCHDVAQARTAELVAVGWPLKKPLVNMRQSTKSAEYRARGVLRDRVLRYGTPLPQGAAAARVFRRTFLLSYALVLGGLLLLAHGWGDARYIRVAWWALAVVPVIRLIPVLLVRPWPSTDRQAP